MVAQILAAIRIAGSWLFGSVQANQNAVRVDRLQETVEDMKEAMHKLEIMQAKMVHEKRYECVHLELKLKHKKIKQFI